MFCVVLAAGAASATENRPLSVIDWLNDLEITAAVPRDSSDVTDGVETPQVTVTPLEGETPRQIGLAPASVTGLPGNVWSDTPGADLAAAIATLPDPQLPAAQALTYTVLLAESDPPTEDETAFHLARIDGLIRYGALDPALAMLEQIGPERSGDYFQRYLDISLLNGTPDRACGILAAEPALAPSETERIYCLARQGEWDTAALVLGSADAIGVMDPLMAEALARFLDPDLFESSAPMEPPQQITPLLFRLFEAAGQRLPTVKLPRAFAHTDLDGSAGWKAQIQSAERLSRSGAMPANRLIGIYSDGRPAASGGVWDRVRAIQLFDTALSTNSADAVAKTLPGAWAQMRAAGLTVPFAQFYADQIPYRALDGAAADIAYRVLLLSPDYETAATTLPDRARARPFLQQIALGAPSDLANLSSLEQAIADAFAPDAAPDATLVAQSRNDALGLSILQSLPMLEDGAAGDAARLERTLATLRAWGLEDTARSAALQILITRTVR